jgi:wyosine [tRNA(Phe)-imidazoG37] synthetase (radical SAM superfamily)
MDCNVNHSIFLRSNGSLACWCDYGSLKTLQEFDPTLDYAEDVYLGKVYGYIREQLAKGTMPFPDYCSKCMVLQINSPFVSTYPRDRYIDTFQVEPALACQLDCPGCIPMKERKTRIERTSVGHLILAPKVFEKILGDFNRAGMRIRVIDFQGHGEPTLNRDIWSMIRMAKSLFPDSRNTMCTHANLDFADDMVAAGLDEIIYAIDGMSQESYAPYRVHGDFEQAYSFMRSFSRAARARNAKIDTVWKYVLFRHNDSPEQLSKAQELAIDAQVTELRFIITQLGPLSTRIIDESDIPRVSKKLNVKVLNYKVDVKQLDEGITLARSGIKANQLPQAAQSASFVAAMMKRLFAEPQTVPPKFAGYLSDLHELANLLPESARTTIVGDIQHLSSPKTFLSRLLGT